MSEIVIDRVGKVSRDWDLMEFKVYYEQHKEELDKIHAHRLNSHVRLFDENGNRYKIIRRYGKTIFQRVSENMLDGKRDIIEQIYSLGAKLNELNRMFEELSKNKNAESESDDGFQKRVLAIAEKPEPMEKYKC